MGERLAFIREKTIPLRKSFQVGGKLSKRKNPKSAKKQVKKTAFFERETKSLTLHTHPEDMYRYKRANVGRLSEKKSARKPHRAHITGIMRGEWGNMGMSITDNVLVNYCNGVDALMAGGVTTFDAMLPYITNQLPNYENDAVIVTAMRNACHHNLYALANSSGMNGIGKDSVIHKITPQILKTVKTATIIIAVLMAACVTLWIIGSKKFKKTEAYANYKQAKQDKKAKA